MLPETEDWVEGGEDSYLDSLYEDRYESFGADPYDYDEDFEEWDDDE